MTSFLRPTAWFGNLSESNTDPFVTGKVALAHMGAALEPLLGKRIALIYKCGTKHVQENQTVVALSCIPIASMYRFYLEDHPGYSSNEVVSSPYLFAI